MTSRQTIQRIAAILLAALIVPAFTQSDEWKARHGLIVPGGVVTLTIPPSPSEVFFPGPSDPSSSNAWFADLQGWRANRLQSLRYDGSEYTRPELAWTRRSFSQVQLLVWDRSIYDPDKREYTVDKFLSDTEKRIGPIDIVLLWHVYPNIGVDDRNQFDLLRDLPGGIPGLQKLVSDFHRHNVKVLFPILAWDSGTRPESSTSDVALVSLLKQIGADGINFDTLESVPAAFRDTAAAQKYPLMFEPQFEIRDESIAWSTLGWNDWVTWEDVTYPVTPMVSRSRWLEPRHMVHVTDRFTRDKTDSLQHAFFNGEGYAVLENLWGFEYPMNPRDAEAMLRFTRVERAFAENLSSSDWRPHSPAALQSGVFASEFPIPSRTLWTIVNRNEFDVTGEQLRVPHKAGVHYFDLWHGVELQPTIHGESATLSFPIDGLGFGAVLATTDPSSPNLTELLIFMCERSKQPLRSYSNAFVPTPQKIVEIARTKRTSTSPEGMVAIPAADFDFSVRGIEIEGGNDPGVDVQYPWEDIARRTHRHRIHVDKFFIDRTPVTNAQFKKFLDSTHYKSSDDHNFLQDWREGTYPQGWENKPVTWVSLEDARAYATWAGKRLPHEWEWQYAAQSEDARLYPWGETWDATAVPASDRSPVRGLLSDVSTHPRGASPFGVLDMAGNVSQWTDEFQDPHTRAAIVRGGAAYQPHGSVWYFPQTYRLDEHQKLLLISPGRDRSGTVGFRCVVDAQQ